MATAQTLDTVWNRTHPDFRVSGTSDNGAWRAILVCRSGITTLVDLVNLTSEEIAVRTRRVM